uniref:Uncharacterized protein n=1 Tax=Proboscia inermis TaxID=420281 RepID=A0A7S0C8S8_9STRA|mmetsp:Transcript_33721/g.33990  ORF Transcript_33721/g.33990 Transcript_33721/m.33990 type:complete len:100 (+) Transcript_33721:617-916(+)
MDTDEGEVDCDLIDIVVDDGAAVLQTVRSLLGLPALDGAIDHTAAAEANWKKLEIARPWAEAKAWVQAKADQAKAAQAFKEEVKDSGALPAEVKTEKDE